MSTLTPSEAGRAPTWDAIVQERDAQVHHQTAFIPRSALPDGPRTRRANTLNDARPVLDTPAYSNVNIDIPLDPQSSLHMEVTHNGMVTELVARFESYGAYSDVCEVSPDEPTESASGIDNAAAHQEQVEQQYDAYTIGTSGRSPRKSIPTQWLTKSTAPNLATAQRAKARTSKTAWDNDSPDEVKTLRGTRSSVDLSRAHGKDSATFLTKEALATVESTIASPTSPLSPSRLHGSPTKRPWNSPTGSPLRSSARHQSSFSLRMSPTKSTHLNTDSISAGHSRASSSVATSTGRASFHTAQGSPVRSPASTEHSFQSAAENPEDLDVPSVDLYADSDDEQVQHESGSPQSAAARTNAKEKRKSLTPRLSLVIPTPRRDNREDSMDSRLVGGPLSPESPTQVSRIPRAGTSSKTASPVRTIKRIESVKSLQKKIKELQLAMQMDAAQLDAIQIPLPATPAPAPLRHVRTVDSTGSTPIISRTSGSLKRDGMADFASEDDRKQSTRGKGPAIAADNASPDQPDDAPDCDASYEHAQTFKVDEEAAHNAVQPKNVPWGVPTSLAHGTTLTRPISVPTIVVMMAHNLDIGNLNLNTQQHEAVSDSKNRVDDVENTSSSRGRSERYVPSDRNQADSGRSSQSSMGSDLRATATEFVPQPPTTTSPIDASTENTPLSQSLDIADLPDATVLDRNGVPFLWYMYGVQFAYEQGYRNGRPKSPKKYKPNKNQRKSISSPADAAPYASKAVPINNPGLATPLSAAAKQRMTSAELMPPPPLPTRPRQEETHQENYHPSSSRMMSPPQILEPIPNQPFAHQLSLIEQTANSNRANSNAPRHFGVNPQPWVGFPSGPRNAHPPTYYTVPRHGHRNNRGNGLYGGRGNAAGVPIDATAPFPSPTAPQGRPDQRQTYEPAAVDYSDYTIGKESCGLVNITVATERAGGEPCNACAPDH
ncbi:uncharacterized protein J4E88_007218 [Alternaria novae-zelandiae]|uniref:uncharacterized protein n=1 Tax=Alternaria novae-zelandiae TaxID=430562 RepID=UPI0020C30058|nr:uncharacterized protein J4E88_007218 [Alternaria novae-zelandiae]KAI4676304.1 hypothetical protein J4E88_007218 [Alternaria novae-zelandiae]